MEKSIPSEKYDRQYFEKLNKGYREFASKSQLHPVYYRALDFAGLQKGDKVLDVGCGRGELVYLCALKGCECLGVDFSSTAVELSKNLLASLPPEAQKKARVLKRDAKNLGLDSRSFDIVFMLDIVEHLYPGELKAALAECFRVLKPGGRLLIYTSPNKISLAPARFLAHLVGVSLRSDGFHVNEQSFFGLKNYLASDFTVKKFWMQKHRNYWFNGVPERGAVIKLVARILDGLLDNPLSEFLITRTFLKYFLGTGIWIVASPKKR